MSLTTDDTLTEVRGGTILDGLGGRFEAGTVVIRGDRIVEVGPAGARHAARPEPARIIDATGKTVMPGMVDAHIHFLGHTTTDPYRSHFTPSDGVKFVRSASSFTRRWSTASPPYADSGMGRRSTSTPCVRQSSKH